MTVVAEGVETGEQLEYLAENHCDMLQGYYLCRPLPESKIKLLLANRTLSYSAVKEHSGLHSNE